MKQKTPTGLETEKLLDDIGWRILCALQEDARLSFAELGRRVGLSLPAVAERVRRLEEAGIITGYRAEVDTSRIGRPMLAFIRVNVPGERYPAFTARVGNFAEVLECHHLTGSDSFILKVVTASVPKLEALITRLSHFGQTTTSLVLSSPVTRRILEPERGIEEVKGNRNG